MGIRLNLGSGRKKLEGYVNVDIEKAFAPDLVWDLNKTPYPFKENEVEEVVMEHCLEHLEDHRKVLAELRRICKPNAVLHIRVPHYSMAFYHPFHKTAWSTAAFFFEPYDQWFEVRKRGLKWLRYGWRQRKLYYPFFLASPLIDFLANLCVDFCERFWCYLVGGFEEIRFELVNKK